VLESADDHDPAIKKGKPGEYNKNGWGARGNASLMGVHRADSDNVPATAS
jgi:hypothetical protein